MQDILGPGVVIDPLKFQTCAYRSEKTLLVMKGCCGKPKQRVEGFICNLLAIKGITEATCASCPAYSNGKKTD